MQIHPIRFLLYLTLLCFYGAAISAQGVDIRLYEKVPMRDGIHLSANLFVPDNGEESHPVILIYTPYVNDEAVERGMFFAKEGYVFMTLDLRGRGNSEGEFLPFEKDGIDGHDAIEWISEQPWCNGTIGMMGGSYRGMVQWMTLKQKPKALKTIVPTASVGPGLDFPKSGGIFRTYALQWLNLTGGRTDNANIFANNDYWKQKALKMYAQKIPFKDWDSVALGKRNPIFQNWIAHPDFDAYWQGFYPRKEDYQSFDIPILSITGYFDGDQPGAMTYYQDHMQHGNPEGKANHYLVLGPWSHGGTRKPETTLGGHVFGENAKLDMLQLHLEWFNWTLKDGKKPAFLQDRVAYYVIGRNSWQYTDQFQDMTRDTLTYYLSSSKSDAKLLIDPGLLSTEKTKKADSDRIVNDPLGDHDVSNYQEFYRYKDPIPIEEAGRLIYISNELDTDMALAGRFKAGLYLSMDVPDTDLRVFLYALDKKGQTTLLGTDKLRMRYREGLSKQTLATPGEVFFCEFDDFYITAIELEKGSRFVLTINAINSAEFQKNHNSGKEILGETKEDAKTATIHIHHSPKHPSYLKIPLGRLD